jgi:hypothetical protein
MFDLEGMPPHLDELDKIYLWGTQVFGKTQGKFMPAVSGFGDDGDREGWKQFLTNAQSIFQQFGDIPFVHWHHYEKTHLDEYVERYGDPKELPRESAEICSTCYPLRGTACCCRCRVTA